MKKLLSVLTIFSVLISSSPSFGYRIFSKRLGKDSAGVERYNCHITCEEQQGVSSIILNLYNATADECQAEAVGWCPNGVAEIVLEPLLLIPQEDLTQDLSEDGSYSIQKNKK